MRRCRVIGDGLRLAIGTLTAVKVRPPVRLDRATAQVAIVAAPLAVLPIGVAAGAAAALGRWVLLPSLVSAVLVVAVFALGSRALHLDGLADTADGLTSSYDRDRALEIMRRGDTGPAGAAAVVLTLLVQISALATVLSRPWGWVTGPVLLCVARCALLISCRSGVPAARPGGLGATVAGVVPRSVAWPAGVAAGVVAAGVLMLSGRPWWQGAVAVALGGLVVGMLVARCRRRFGGITGDVLGACIEVAAASLLAAAAGG